MKKLTGRPTVRLDDRMLLCAKVFIHSFRLSPRTNIRSKQLDVVVLDQRRFVDINNDCEAESTWMMMMMIIRMMIILSSVIL